MILLVYFNYVMLMIIRTSTWFLESSTLCPRRNATRARGRYRPGSLGRRRSRGHIHHHAVANARKVNASLVGWWKRSSSSISCVLAVCFSPLDLGKAIQFMEKREEEGNPRGKPVLPFQGPAAAHGTPSATPRGALRRTGR